jgi:phosphoribosylaminoimidazole-succinocarboxamide synthase
VSAFWFNKLRDVIPNHVVTTNIEEMPQEVHKYKDVLESRVMLVRKARVVKIEAIVRGYLTGRCYHLYDLTSLLLKSITIGSGWSEYKKSGTVHGIPLPPGLVESDKLPQPLFTPSTKADQGEHDENISPARGKSLVLHLDK